MKQFTNFRFEMKTEIVFGRGTETEVGKLITKHGGTKVMLVYGKGSIKRNGLYDRIVQSLNKENIPFIELGGIKANPLRSVVEKGLRYALAENVDFLLAVGGGSTIDTAKAIALALANDGEYWKFYRGTPVEKIASVGAVPTIAAAGSETSGSSVLVDDIDTGEKVGFMWSICKPVFSIMNPELTYSVPVYQTAAGAVDIMAHTVSRYFSRASSTLGDEFGEGLMRTVVKFAPIAISQPDNYEARSELMLAASFSHNDVTGIGRSALSGGEHALESQLSGFYDTTHGAGLSVVMPAMLQYFVNHGTDSQIAKVAQFGVKVFDVPKDSTDLTTIANKGISYFRKWLKSIGMPLTLKELGIPEGDLEAIINRCMVYNNNLIHGYMDLDREAVTEIFRSIVC